MGLFKTKQTIEPDAIPTTVEEAIPVQDFYEDGIALVGRGLWSKTFRFSDINYATASRERKEELFLGYSAILNSFDAGAMTKITVCNRRQSQSRFEKQNLLPLRDDRLDRYRDEYNRMLTENAEQSSGITQEKYLTVTVQKPNYNEAKSYFNRVESEFAALFLSLGSRLEPLDAAEKLRVLFDFYHYGAEDDFLYEPERYGRRGYTFKDAIAPDSMEFRSDYFKIDGRYGRVLYLRDYANFIKDSFLAELTDIDRGLMFSIDCNPIPTDEAIRQGEGKLLAVETNISNWQRKQNRNQNFSADVPYDMEKQRAESREFLDDLVSRDQRMIPSLMTLCHTAESKEQLDADTESIRQCARKHLCSMNVLRWQQLEGLNTVLPYGVPKLSIRRTLTTEALAVFMPFRVQEICHRNGIYFANNAISKNLMTVNRAQEKDDHYNNPPARNDGGGDSLDSRNRCFGCGYRCFDCASSQIDRCPNRDFHHLRRPFGGFHCLSRHLQDFSCRRCQLFCSCRLDLDSPASHFPDILPRLPHSPSSETVCSVNDCSCGGSPGVLHLIAGVFILAPAVGLRRLACLSLCLPCSPAGHFYGSVKSPNRPAQGIPCLDFHPSTFLQSDSRVRKAS